MKRDDADGHEDYPPGAAGNRQYHRRADSGCSRHQRGLFLTEKMVRLELEGEEVNLFARGKKNGKDLLVVGEAELRLSSVGKLRQLEKKVALVKKTYPGDCIPLLITHFARPQVLEAARERGIIVVQSFEW